MVEINERKWINFNGISARVNVRLRGARTLMNALWHTSKFETVSREPSRKSVRTDGERAAAITTQAFEESSPVSARS